MDKLLNTVLCTRVSILLMVIGSVFGSLGDRHPTYKKCRTEGDHMCGKMFARQQKLAGQSAADKLMGWSCEEEVKYSCMWEVMQINQREGLGPMQFHGKWPFVRILGFQEFASSLFSLLNFYLNWRMMRQLMRLKRIEKSRKMPWYAFGIIECIGWLFSAMYHAKDTPLTEIMDYTGALLMNAGFAVALLIHVSSVDNRSRTRPLIAVLCVFVLHHIHGMMHKIDYGYNLMVHLCLGACTTIGWIVWCIYIQFYSYRKHMSLDENGSLYCLLAFTLNTTFVILELWDFPPIYHVLDAHALWHLSSALPIVLFWKFVVSDLSVQTRLAPKNAFQEILRKVA